ncbi:MAG TPA: L-histidine N(alpha)-methyltransferase [Burkholderiales bacterium]|nr:L-histidine N(alpha)-methyltransferase [Burkholderiales bacterium]
MDQHGPRFAFHDLRPDTGSFLGDVIAGLSRARKALPPKYFYDERGSKLFEAICRTPEYYVTRTEVALMRERAAAIARRIGPNCAVIEYGSGSARKTRILLDALEPAAYVPIDIAREQLRATAAGIARDYPELPVTAVCADYSRALELPGLDGLRALRRVVYFPGSTIGNFTPAEAAGFLGNVRRLAGPGGGLLIGVDLRKDAARLNAAYNDRRGVTAAFNLNLLARINRELGADFDLAAFRHQAFYNEPLGRIEMHLLSLADQRVSIGRHVIRFRAGETIHTENSCKYSVTGFQSLARGAGFDPAACWVDDGRLFGVHFLQVPR